MIEIKEVRSCRERKEFLNFPLNLYKDNPCFVPPLYNDEKKIFDKDYIYNDTCDVAYFIAEIEGKTVGRISVIIQKAANKKNGQKRARFDRFDCIEDFEVAKALFAKAEEWALSRGMDTMHGPLGFSDLEREGLLIEGFDQLSTFEEQYNAPYYKDFIERLGFEKEVDWTESKITKPTEEEFEQMVKMSEFVMRRYNLHISHCKTAKEFLDKHLDGFFDIVDKAYEDIYGTVPFTDGMKKQMVSNFKLIIDPRFVIAVLDENEKVVCIGICFPSLAKAVQKTQGRLTPGCLFRLLKAIKNPDIIDLGLIGVDPAYFSRGVNAIVCAELAKMLQNPRIKWAETNLNLENNTAINGMWNHFGREMHKRRRAFVKKLN